MSDKTHPFYAGTTFDGHDTFYTDVESKLDKVKASTDRAWLDRVVRDQDSQITVRQAAQRRLRKMGVETQIDPDKPVGFEVVVECCDKMVYIPGAAHNTTATVHRKGSESAARKAGMMRPNAQAIIEVRAFTSKQWDAAFGLKQRM
jgi:hypothetical protein